MWKNGGVLDFVRDLYYEAGKARKLFITGHSLGGALATIAAAYLAFDERMKISGIYTIGSPRWDGRQAHSALTETWNPLV